MDLSRSILRYPAYAAFGLAVFLIALVVTFPDQRLKEIATVQLEAVVGNDYNVEVDDLDLWWLTGVELENITITERRPHPDQSRPTAGRAGHPAGRPPDESVDPTASDNAPERPEQKPMKVTIPQVAAGLSPLSSLANFAPTVDFLVDPGGGEISGSYVHGSDQRSVEVDIDDVDLGKTSIIESFLGVPVLGTLDGQAVLTFHPTRRVLTGGQVTLEGRKLMVDKATIMTDKIAGMGFIDVPPTSFGNLDAKLSVDGGPKTSTPTVNFDQFEFRDGRDVRGQIWGDLNLGRTSRQSRAKLKMRFHFDKKYIQSNDLASILQVKYFRDGKAKDWYGFVLWGRLGDPQFKGAPTAAEGPNASEATKKPAKTGADNAKGKTNESRK